MRGILILLVTVLTIFGSDFSEGLKAYDSSDFKLAVEKFDLACKANEKLGCELLGMMYQVGKNLTKDNQKALEAYQKACELGSAKGCAGVAGLNVGIDDVKAQEFFKKACELNDKHSCSIVGSYLIDAKKYKEASKFFDKSCTLGDRLGCEFAGDLKRSKQQ